MIASNALFISVSFYHLSKGHFPGYFFSIVMEREHVELQFE